MDTDCPHYPYLVCSEQHICEHKGVFPVYEKEFAGIIVLTFLIALANVSGIGGGGLIIPISMALFTFTTKEAIAISGFTIFTGSVTRFFYSYNQRHPEKDATLIDYGIVIVMMPLVLLGSYIGVLMNLMLPPILLSLFLTLILILLTAQSFIKGKQMYQKETFDQQRRQLTELSQIKNNQNLVSEPGTNYEAFQEELYLGSEETEEQ